MNTPTKVLIVAGLAYWWWRRNQEGLVEGPLQPVPINEVPPLNTPIAKLLVTSIPDTPAAKQLAKEFVAQALEAVPQQAQVRQERQTQQEVAAIQAVGDSEGAEHQFLTEAVAVSRHVQAQPAPAPAVQAQTQEAPVVREPLPQDAHSVQVTTTVGDDALLDEAQVQKSLSPALQQAVQAASPAHIPFDDLPEFSQTVLVRGYAMDYVAPQAIAEPAYSAALKASTQSGLPIGWTQLLIARGIKPEQVGKVAVDLIDSFGDMLAKEALLADRDARQEAKGAAQAGAKQADDPSMSGGVFGQPVRPQLNLKRLRSSLMGRWAPLPVGVKMGDGEA